MDHPLLMTEGRGEDFYAVQALRAGRLLNAPPFTTIIVDDMGHMARMTTVAPSNFAAFKDWMSGLEDREMMKRRRDALQSVLVHQLVTEYLPQWKRESAEAGDQPEAGRTDQEQKSSVGTADDAQASPAPARPQRPRG